MSFGKQIIISVFWKKRGKRGQVTPYCSYVLFVLQSNHKRGKHSTRRNMPMGLLDYFWGARKKTKANVKKEVSGKCQELLQWSGYWNQLVDADHYISR